MAMKQNKNHNGRRKTTEFFKIANPQYFSWIGLVRLVDMQGIHVALYGREAKLENYLF